MSGLTIIVVNWNSRDELNKCLASLKASGTKTAYQVIVVDNHSSDDTVAFLHAHYPEVMVIANTENRGFAAANNQALGKTTSRYVLLLNPDTYVHRGALDELVNFMESHPDAAAVGPALRNEDGSPQNTGVRFPTNWNILVEALFLDRVFPRSRVFGRHKELFADQDAPRKVQYVQGACLMLRTEVARTIGDMDEQFFLYFEEVDWCKRMYDAGYSVYMCPSAVVTHFANAELGHFDAHRLVHYHRSLILFYKKHYSQASLMVLRVLLAVRSLLRLFVWTAVPLTRPSLRHRAVSALRGYLQVLRLVWVA